MIDDLEDHPIDPGEIPNPKEYHGRYNLEPIEFDAQTIYDRVYPQQALAIFDTYRRLWMCCGVGYGKTFTGARMAHRHITEISPNGRGLICANTREQLTSATLPPFFEMLQRLNMPYTIHSRPPASWGAPRLYDSYKNVLCVRVREGVVAQILLRSLVNFAAIKGIELEWAWIDEIADAPEEGVNVITDRMRGKRTQYRQLLVTGSPLGEENWAWERFSPENQKRKHKVGVPMKHGPQAGRPLHEVIFASSTENKHLPDDYHQAQRETYSGTLYLQQVHGRIVSQSSGLTYYAYNKEKNGILKYPYVPGKPLLWTWDFNVADGTALCSVVAQLHTNHTTGQDELQVLCEVVEEGGNIEQIVSKALAMEWFSTHPGGFEIHGDGTQWAKSAAVSDYWVIFDALEEHFQHSAVYNAPGGPEIEVLAPRSNPLVKNRINSVNALFHNAAGQRRLFIDRDKTPHLDRDLRKLRPDPKENKLINKKQNKKLSHASDALGYLVYYYWPIENRGHGARAANTRGY